MLSLALCCTRVEMVVVPSAGIQEQGDIEQDWGSAAQATEKQDLSIAVTAAEPTPPSLMHISYLPSLLPPI